jgi:hypothetical protein
VRRLLLLLVALLAASLGLAGSTPAVGAPVVSRPSYASGQPDHASHSFLAAHERRPDTALGAHSEAISRGRARDDNLAPAKIPGAASAAETESGASSLLRLSSEDSWGNPNSLARHFRDHGADFGATSAEDYANQASQFFQRSQREGLPTKIDSDGVIRVYDPETNTFGSFNPDGTTKTFFTPKSGIDYWNRQPGSPPWTGQ